MKKIISLFLIIPCFLALASKEEEAIKERLKPVGNICVENMDCGVKVMPISLAGNAAVTRSGLDVYNSACGTCHSIGLAGAPKFGNKISWGSRTDKGVDALVLSVINGLNGMPPKGLCMDCTDGEISSAVNYMLSELK
jgi:cytochrome c5